jgi:hypothetical protein
MLSLRAVVAAALTPVLNRVPGSTHLMVRAWIQLGSPAEEQPTEQPRQTTAAYFGGRTRTLASRQEPSLDVRLVTRNPRPRRRAAGSRASSCAGAAARYPDEGWSREP